MHIASFCEGEVSFADKTQSRRLHVLMDTGATSANYISKTCLDEMRNSLGQGKVKPMKGVVTLGDSQTKIQIEEAVQGQRWSRKKHLVPRFSIAGQGCIYLCVKM